MNNKEIKKEDKIFKAAYNVFLLYGYHGSKMNQIAEEAEVMKASVHYYFRSKENLYKKVVFHVIENLLSNDIHLVDNQITIEKQKWFIYTELYNNQSLFEEVIKNLYPNDWIKIKNQTKHLLKHPFIDITG